MLYLLNYIATVSKLEVMQLCYIYFWNNEASLHLVVMKHKCLFLWRRSICHLWSRCICHLGSKSICHLGSKSICHVGSKSICHLGSRSICHLGSRSICHLWSRFIWHLWSTPGLFVIKRTGCHATTLASKWLHWDRYNYSVTVCHDPLELYPNYYF